MYKYKTICIKQFAYLLTSLKGGKYWYHYVLFWPNRKIEFLLDRGDSRTLFFRGVIHFYAVYSLEICICYISIEISNAWLCSSYSTTYCVFLWMQCSKFHDPCTVDACRDDAPFCGYWGIFLCIFFITAWWVKYIQIF